MSGRFALPSASAICRASAPTSSGEIWNCGGRRIDLMCHGKAQPGEFVRRAAERTVATSSSRVASGVAMKSGLLSCCAALRTAASCHRGIFIRSAVSSDFWRTAWRRLRARRGAVSGTSSPKTSTASACSASLSEAARAGPRCRMSMIRASNSCSLADSPRWKRSAPTNSRSAKLASSEARGEPMPMLCAMAATPPDGARTSSLRRRLWLRHRRRSQERLAQTQRAVDELVAESAAIAEEVAVDLAVVAVEDTAQLAVALAGRSCCSRGRNARRPTAPSRKSHLRV